ncbi:MAG: hypothetical protein GY849_16395 [Deltaproteobacteria bacterium]|nr:hypothetical protein [Deltaproteobacteria bacterium]
MEAYKIMPLKELFEVEEVSVEIPLSGMPGPTRFKALCQKCGIVVRDKREVYKKGQTLCRPCASGAYYRPVRKERKGG